MLEFEVNVLKFWKSIMLFCTGGAGYVSMELVWRGWSHGSMFLAGGSCFLLLGRLCRIAPRPAPAVRGLVGAGVITSVELLAGLVANRDYRVWDYRGMPMNFYGQICLPFCLLWIPVGLGGMALYEALDSRLAKLALKFDKG